MANLFKESRWIIDTPSALLLKATYAPGIGPLAKIKNIRWVGATTAGHQCVILDEDGIVYWESVAAGANNVESDLEDRIWQKDFSVPILNSGRLYIELYSGVF